MPRPLRSPLSPTSPMPQPGDTLLAALVFLSSRFIEVAEILRPQKGDPKILEPPFLQTLSLEGQSVCYPPNSTVFRDSNRNLVRRFLIDRIMYIQLVRKYNVPRLEDITVSAAAQWAANGNERGSCVRERARA